MIDTIFFLLVFFMVTWVSLVKLSGLPLNLPKQNTAVAQPQRALVLSLDPNGHYYLNGAPTPSNLWQYQLRTLLAAGPQSVVVLNVAPDQSTQTLVSLLDQVSAVVSAAHSSAKIVIATKRVAE
jgi:biopolymer transport protein ExbD